MKKLNLRNETCRLVYCKVYDKNGIYVGKGYSLMRQNGFIIPTIVDVRGRQLELEQGIYEIRHSDIEKLVVVNWSVQ